MRERGGGRVRGIEREIFKERNCEIYRAKKERERERQSYFLSER